MNYFSFLLNTITLLTSPQQDDVVTHDAFVEVRVNQCISGNQTSFKGIAATLVKIPAGKTSFTIERPLGDLSVQQWTDERSELLKDKLIVEVKREIATEQAFSVTFRVVSAEDREPKPGAVESVLNVTDKMMESPNDAISGLSPTCVEGRIPVTINHSVQGLRNVLFVDADETSKNLQAVRTKAIKQIGITVDANEPSCFLVGGGLVAHSILRMVDQTALVGQRTQDEAAKLLWAAYDRLACSKK